MPVRMELSRILIRENVDAHVVELREADGERVFPIVIGLNEAAAINRRLMGEEPPRPQTHELLANIIVEDRPHRHQRPQRAHLLRPPHPAEKRRDEGH